MKRVVGIDQAVKVEETIKLSTIPMDTPIYFKDETGKFGGMVIKELDSLQWIARFCTGYGATGLHPDRKTCLESCLKHGYKFYVLD